MRRLHGGLVSRLIVLLLSDSVEAYLGCYALVLGGWLLAPWQAVPLRAALGGVAVEPVWGPALAVVGLAEVLAVALDVRRLRLLATIGQACVWAFLAGATAMAAPRGIGLPTFALAALAAAVALGQERNRDF